MISVKPPSGTRDFLAADIFKQRQVIDVIQQVYESFGFEPLATPAFENLSTLLGKYGEEGDQLLFRILKRGDKLQTAAASSPGDQNELSDLALKYDLTVPLARVMARYGGQLPKFFKRYQIQPVWRADRPAKGRFREFIQCDLDVCGSAAPVVEAEVLAAACTVYDRLQFPDYSIVINHREVLRGLIEASGIPLALEGTALVAIDKLDKIGKEGVAVELSQRGFKNEQATKLLALLDETSAANSNRACLQFLRDRLTRPAALAGLDNLTNILKLSEATPAGQRLRVVPSLARGLSYYTGAIFEAVAPASAGSFGGGGRYDGLLGMFSGQHIPACGFSIGLDRLLLLLEQQNYFNTERRFVDVLFANFSDTLADTLAAANRLRQCGLVCEVFPDSKSLKQQFNYAATRQVRFMAFLGTSELQAGELRFKRQSDGIEITLSLAELESGLDKIAPSEENGKI